ncbi:16S rRNA (cytidine(1402)-2'-O)-methyltransferase [Patescibacteria group bacterium]|nr:16S rRNA (cytidine(1402)-2'-O)-methyltransferase [Patescibacteria group bacterium]MBU1889993.1 16S rRNA (cytidine(1402)-2'-O)-methyltransferase [Patescibacteria group bacterium]
MANIFIVATPIGNLEDISLRAIRILGEVDTILCEDTRVTKKLLQHYNIEKPTLSYHQHSRISKLDRVLELLKGGKSIAVVTDAGTPGISDPGNKLVQYVLEKLGSDVSLVPVPGASALTSAISVAGVTSDRFLFLGFLPHKKGKETLLKQITESKVTVVFYESPHRIVKTLTKLNQFLSPDRKVVMFRELTKKFEERIGETIEECMNYIENNPDKVRGEFVVIVSGR